MAAEKVRLAALQASVAETAEGKRQLEARIGKLETALSGKDAAIEHMHEDMLVIRQHLDMRRRAMDERRREEALEQQEEARQLAALEERKQRALEVGRFPRFS